MVVDVILLWELVHTGLKMRAMVPNYLMRHPVATKAVILDKFRYLLCLEDPL